MPKQATRSTQNGALLWKGAGMGQGEKTELSQGWGGMLEEGGVTLRYPRTEKEMQPSAAAG